MKPHIYFLDFGHFFESLHRIHMNWIPMYSYSNKQALKDWTRGLMSGGLSFDFIMFWIKSSLGNLFLQVNIRYKWQSSDKHLNSDFCCNFKYCSIIFLRLEIGVLRSFVAIQHHFTSYYLVWYPISLFVLSPSLNFLEMWFEYTPKGCNSGNLLLCHRLSSFFLFLL